MTDLSATGAAWRESSPHTAIVNGLIDATGMPIAAAIMAAGRGLTREGIAAWLDPKMRDLMPDPSTLTDMDKIVARLTRAVKNSEKIGVFGDYDVDGACSAALLHDLLTPLGCEVSIHIPDRYNEGYGPNSPALLKLKDQGCGLIVTVDCGITAHGPIADAVDQGLDVLIIDHHIAGPDLPQAHAVVNPNRLEDDGTLGHLSGAGVCFMVMAGLIRHLRNQGLFEKAPEPDLKVSLDLVALATICDVVPLLGLNRAFIRSGLAVMAQRKRLGLAALSDVSRLDHAPDSHALGYMLGPRINAGGRIGNSSLGVNLLTTKDPQEATRIAGELDVLNTRRQEIEREVTAESIAQLEGSDDMVLMASSEGWPHGVVGISASRIKSHFEKPAAVIGIETTKEGLRIGKGSARSLMPFKMGSAVIAACQKGLLIAGGGHDMAAGFTLDMGKLEDFKQFMNDRARKELGQEQPLIERDVASPLAAGAANLILIEWLDRLGPYGAGFEHPLFILRSVKIDGLRSMGSEAAHRAMRIRDQTGALNAVAFRVAGTPLATAIDRVADGRPIDVLGRLSRNIYKGREGVQFVIEDLREPK
jgi:single-stranded-DNA-specific exonuclease